MMEKSANSVFVAELRHLNNVVEAEEKSFVDKWMTPEFWTMTSLALTNILAVGVLVGWLSAEDVEQINKALTAIIGATEIIVVNSVLVWKYISGRNAIREKMIAAKYHYMETLAVERLRQESA